jgi:hypothetical protein
MMRKDAHVARFTPGAGRALRLVGRGGGAMLTSLLTLSVAAQAATPKALPLPVGAVASAAPAVPVATPPAASRLLSVVQPPRAPSEGQTPSLPTPPPAPKLAPLEPQQPLGPPLQPPRIEPPHALEAPHALAPPPPAPVGPAASPKGATPPAVPTGSGSTGSVPPPVVQHGSRHTARRMRAPAVVSAVPQPSTALPATAGPAASAVGAPSGAVRASRRHVRKRPHVEAGGPGFFLVPAASTQGGPEPSVGSGLFADFRQVSTAHAGGASLLGWILAALLGALILAALCASPESSRRALAARWPHRPWRAPWR